MSIEEMHVWFRQYAQQMGLQNYRAILPEQIDLMINTSISDIINQLIKENIGVTNDRVITDNSKIGQINAFSTLYKVKEIRTLFSTERDPGESDDEFIDQSQTKIEGSFSFKSAFAKQGKIYYNNIIRTDYSTLDDFNKENRTFLQQFPEALFYVDFSLNYKPIFKGIKNIETNPTVLTNVDEYLARHCYQYIDTAEETNYFPVRLIDDAYLADTINDFVLRPRLRSPIMVMYNHDMQKGHWGIDLYIEPFESKGDGRYTLRNNLLPYNLRISYISKPAKVKFDADVNGGNVDCDLPESMHVDILKHAVDLYRISISGSLQAGTQQNQNQQRENARNTYRNEGTN